MQIALVGIGFSRSQLVLAQPLIVFLTGIVT